MTTESKKPSFVVPCYKTPPPVGWWEFVQTHSSYPFKSKEDIMFWILMHKNGAIHTPCLLCHACHYLTGPPDDFTKYK